MTSELGQLLARTDIGRPLTEDECATLVAAGRVQVAFNDQALLTEGDRGDTMLVLTEGEVVVTKKDQHGEEREICRLGEGSVLGEISLLCDAPRTANVKAADTVRYLELPRDAFEKLLEEQDPAATKAAVAIARILGQRQAKLNERLLQVLSEGPSDDVRRVLDEIVVEWDE
ncbi:MAG: cyclic nucleotide-binding domain-containing protein [Acidobacteriota bacterium]